MTNAEVFAEKFLNMANCAAKQLYSKNKKWTEQTTKWIEQILQKELNSNGKIEVSHEYYRIDSTGWVQRKEELNTRESNLDPHLWNLIAAVEHENASKKWLDEVCKLAYIRCPLRVVIGYGTESFDEKIAVVKDILTKTKAFTDDEQEFMIILGKHRNEFIQGADNFTHVTITKEDIDNEK